jgi:hypothetical protein
MTWGRVWLQARQRLLVTATRHRRPGDFVQPGNEASVQAVTAHRPGPESPGVTRAKDEASMDPTRRLRARIVKFPEKVEAERSDKKLILRQAHTR